jgi:CrcB protein
MNVGSWIAFLTAAAVGAPARYLLDGAVQDRTHSAFPWGTLVVNLSGSLLLGFITGLGLYHGLDDNARTILGAGGVGAYTTFSTFSYETTRLMAQGGTTEAILNTAANLTLGLAAASLGLAVAAVI